MSTSLIRDLSDKSPQALINQYTKDEEAISRAQNFFYRQSAQTIKLCETNLGKSLWKKMGCCSRFWSYISCKSYRNIGHNYLLANPNAYIALERTIINKNFFDTHQAGAATPDLPNRNEKTDYNQEPDNDLRNHRHNTQIEMKNHEAVTLVNEKADNHKKEAKEESESNPSKVRNVSRNEAKGCSEKDENKEKKADELPEIDLTCITPRTESDSPIEDQNSSKQGKN